MFNTLWGSPATDKAARSFPHSYLQNQDSRVIFTLVKGFAIINHIIKYTDSLLFVFFYYLLLGASLIWNGRV